MAKNNHTPSPAASDVVVIRNYPASLIHEHVSSDDGSVFKTLSFRFKDASLRKSSVLLRQQNYSPGIFLSNHPHHFQHMKQLSCSVVKAYMQFA